MSTPTPGVNHHGTTDTSVDFDNFVLDPQAEAEVAQKNNAFINAQPEIEASNDCEGGACKL